MDLRTTKLPFLQWWISLHHRNSQGKTRPEGNSSAYPQEIALQAIIDFDFRQPLDLSIELTLLDLYKEQQPVVGKPVGL